MQIKTPIIPTQNIEITLNGLDEILDYKAICVFVAIGFFLDDDTYYVNKKILKPATNYNFKNGEVEDSSAYFNWHHTPEAISFNTALEKFSNVFETIIKEQTNNKKVILPLSGGIDSRTQAAALHYIGAKDVYSYSYQYKNGYPETKIAKHIANVCNFNFNAFTIEEGYLWQVIDDVSKQNKCFADFTSPRQMAIVSQLKDKGNVFSLGHWGDVLFSNYGKKAMTHNEQVQFLAQKLIKQGGLQLAEILWLHWKLEGSFKEYLLSRISDCLKTISIDNTNARLRAFKSKYWAPRWTTANLSVFNSVHPITLPYYDNRMCELICTIPEAYLKNKKLQIAYIKKRNPKLAEITWQDKRPYNLNNFKNPNLLKSYGYRGFSKLKRSLNQLLGKKYVQRNWELQFLGEKNEEILKKQLENVEASGLLPKSLIKECLTNFYKTKEKQYAHQLNILLVLAKKFQKPIG